MTDRDDHRSMRRFWWGVIAVVVVLVLVFSNAVKAQAVFADGFEAPPPPVCGEVPDGYRVYQKTWNEAFFGNTYPSSGAPLAPMGSFTLRRGRFDLGPDIAGKVITIPFVPSGGVYRLNWLQAQPIWEHGYIIARVGTPYWTISPCRADIRKPELLEFPACGRYAGSSSIFYSGAREGRNVCPVIVGGVYWLTLVFDNPADGYQPDEDTCLGSYDACETNTKHELQSAKQLAELMEKGLLDADPKTYHLMPERVD